MLKALKTLLKGDIIKEKHQGDKVYGYTADINNRTGRDNDINR